MKKKRPRDDPDKKGTDPAQSRKRRTRNKSTTWVFLPPLPSPPAAAAAVAFALPNCLPLRVAHGALSRTHPPPPPWSSPRVARPPICLPTVRRRSANNGGQGSILPTPALPPAWRALSIVSFQVSHSPPSGGSPRAVWPERLVAARLL